MLRTTRKVVIMMKRNNVSPLLSLKSTRHFSTTSVNSELLKDSKLNVEQRKELDTLLVKHTFGKGFSYKLNVPNFSYTTLDLGGKHHVVASVLTDEVEGFDHIILDNLISLNGGENIPLVKRLFSIGQCEACVGESKKDIESLIGSGSGLTISYSENSEETNMEHVGSLASALIYNRGGEHDKRVIAVCENNAQLQQDVVQIIQENYSDYKLLDGSFCNFKVAKSVHQIPESRNYFVAYRDGEIVAGAQFVGEQDVSLNQSGDQKLDMIISLYQTLGLKQSHFGKQSFRSAKFDHLFCLDGCEDELLQLLRVVSTRYNPNVHWIRLVGDARDSNWRRIFNIKSETDIPSAKYLGNLGSYNPQEVHLFAKRHSIGEKTMENIKQGPLFYPSDVANFK